MINIEGINILLLAIGLEVYMELLDYWEVELEFILLPHGSQ
jgi:hypothetical protein